MTSHPRRSRGPYVASVGGSSWSVGPSAQFPSLRECREFAESYGTTADWCEVTDRRGQAVQRYRRQGGRWLRAEV